MLRPSWLSSLLLVVAAPLVCADSPRPLAFRPLPFIARADALEDVRALPDGEVDVGLAALLVAQRADPRLDLEAELARLDELARAVLARLGDPRAGDAAAVAAIAAELAARGIGCVAGGTDGVDPRNAYLDRLLATRQGYCTSLSVLYLAIAERIGLALAFVELPDHVFIRHGAPPRHTNVEATAGGKAIDDAAYRAQHPFDRAAEGVYLVSHPPRRAVAGVLMARALLQWRDEDVAGAEATLREALAWAPDHLYAAYNLAGVALRQGNYGEALARYQRYVERRADHALGWFGLARTRLRLGDLPGADEALARGAALAPKHAEVAQMRAELALARGDDEAALKALGPQVGTLEGRFLRARVLASRMRFAEAEAILRALAREYPRVPEIPRQLAVCLKATNRVDEAARVLEALLLQDPTIDAAKAELGIVREIQGRHGEAADLYLSVLARVGTHDMYLRAVRCLLEARRDSQAAQTADEGSAAHPAERQLPKLAGEIYRDRLNDSARACVAFRAYVARGGADSAILRYLETHR